MTFIMVRFKNRYIAVEIVPKIENDKALTLKSTALQNAIQEKVQHLYGDFGSAAIKAGFQAKYCNAQTRIALIKSRHGPHKFILNSIPLISDVDGRAVTINIIYVSATIKHCFIFVRTYQQKKLEKMWNSFKNDNQRREMQKALMKLTASMKDFKQY
ncbi:ribonuclease P/MRP protein subunit POP5 [Vespa crabro]|uniref:ribonuclease P/MRP protein subunit POP5 n=1 Tax=Vespa crabro TaxID=7445 RepID=UPI001EFFFCDB|nr:ribonuclease P/MRP protein subunit POP5 [Vespa crabro]